MSDYNAAPLFGREGRMVDILERLQSPQTSLGTLWPEPNLHEEATDEIIRLREENARLREALKPFAYYASQIPDDVSDTASTSGTVGDLRAAAAALKETGNE